MKLTIPAVLLAAAALVASAAGQTTLPDGAWVRFDVGCGKQVPNWARAGHATGILTNQPASKTFTSGKWGTALRGMPQAIGRRDRRWCWVVPGVRDVAGWTVSTWVKQSQPLTKNGRVPVLSAGGHRGVVGAAVHKGGPQDGDLTIYVKLVNSQTNHAVTLPNVGSQLSSWTNLAVTLDRKTKVLRVFVNGSLRATDTMKQPANPVVSVLAGSFDGMGCPYDTDEVAIFLRPLAPAELAAFVATYKAAHHGLPNCSRSLRLAPSGTGPPRIGNNAYALTAVARTPNDVLAIFFGDNRCKFNGADLPLDLGAVQPQLKGCLLHTRPLVTISAAAKNGLLKVPLAIPQNAQAGRVMYAQAFGMTPATGDAYVSALWSMAIGH